MEEIIKISGLEYTYPDGTKALKGINLTILKGESVGLIGPNGAGKSTLLLHLNGILRGKGKIKVLDLYMNRENLEKIRSGVGIVFQDPEDQLFMPTVFDDVAFGPINLGYSSQLVRERVRKALKEVEMEGFEERSPHHLSFGETKRIALATVLSMDSRILVIDEPSSNLDPGSRRHLIQLLKKFKTTKIFATHDLELVLELCNRTILLDEGKIVIDGPTKKILENEELLGAHSLEMPLSLKLVEK